MELDEEFAKIVGKVEDKETLEMIGSLKTHLKEQSNKHEEEQKQLLEQLKFYKDAYKESILHGGFVKADEPATSTKVVEDIKPHTFEECLEAFYKNKSSK